MRIEALVEGKKKTSIASYKLTHFFSELCPEHSYLHLARKKKLIYLCLNPQLKRVHHLTSLLIMCCKPAYQNFGWKEKREHLYWNFKSIYFGPDLRTVNFFGAHY